MIEQWKNISEFPNYAVSNLGNIKNIITNKILVGGKDKDGYRQVTLIKNGKQFNRRICRLVALTFIDNPNNLPQVNHKDERVDNDNVNNLEWCTAAYNNTYGNRLNNSRKPVICIETQQQYKGLREAEKCTGILHTSISKACKYTHKTAGGYHWNYISNNY